MSVADRRYREKLALRQEILSAARELLAQEGYESLSMRKIAEKIEYSPAAIYLHFQDKHQLIYELCEETFSLLDKKLERAQKSITDPVERLKAGARDYVEFGLQHPNHYRVTFMTPHHPGERKKIEESVGARTFQILMNTVADAVATGRFRETDVAAISQSLWCTVHGVTALLISHRDCFRWVEKDRLIGLAIDSAIRGLLW